MLSMWKTRLPTTTLQVIMAFNCLPLLKLANDCFCAVSDPRVIAINIWPWFGFAQPDQYPGCNVGLKELKNASAAWITIGKQIKKAAAAAVAAE